MKAGIWPGHRVFQWQGPEGAAVKMGFLYVLFVPCSHQTESVVRQADQTGLSLSSWAVCSQPPSSLTENGNSRQKWKFLFSLFFFLFLSDICLLQEEDCDLGG